MKTLVTTIIVTTALGAATLQAVAAETPGLAEAEEQLEKAQRQVEAVQQQVEAQVQGQLAQVERQLELAQAEVEPPEPPEPPDDSAELDWGNLGATITGSVFGTPARNLVQPLVVGSIATDATALSNVQEDLMVMSRILNKSLERSGERDKQEASGIPLFISGFLGTRRPQSLYLEGYGALFLLGVKFPLVPPNATEEVKIEKPADTTWEKTKRELFGPHNGAPGSWVFNPHQESKPVKFDAERVETLKRDLLEALKNAVNLRNLKPDENIVAAVTGSSARPAAAVKQVFKRGLRNSAKTDDKTVAAVGYAVKTPDDEVRHDTALVIRVKKSDADAFAKGKLDFEEFKKKASITAY